MDRHLDGRRRIRLQATSVSGSEDRDASPGTTELIVLELLPFWAPVFLVFASSLLAVILTDLQSQARGAIVLLGLVAAFVALFGSGLGWLRLGNAWGLLLTPLRLAIFVPLVYYLTGAYECRGESCSLYGDSDKTTPLGLAFLGIPIVSAITLAMVASKRRRKH